MPTLKPDDLREITPELVGDLNRETLEKLALQVVDLALHLANRLNMNSANSSCPPSSDDPYRRQADREKAAADNRDGEGGDAACTCEQAFGEATGQASRDARPLALAADTGDGRGRP